MEQGGENAGRCTDPLPWIAAHLLGTAQLGEPGSTTGPALATLVSCGLDFALHDGKRLAALTRPRTSSMAALFGQWVQAARPAPELIAQLRSGAVLAPDAAPRILFVQAGALEHLGLPGDWRGDVPRAVGLVSAFADRVAVLDLGRPIRIDRGDFVRRLVDPAQEPPWIGAPPPERPAHLEALCAGLARTAAAWGAAESENRGQAAFLRLARHLCDPDAPDGLLSTAAPQPRMRQRRVATLLGLHEDAGWACGDGSMLRVLFADGLRELSGLLEDAALLQISSEFRAHGDNFVRWRHALLPAGSDAGALHRAERALAVAWHRGADGDHAFMLSEAVEDARAEVQAVLIDADEERLVDLLEEAGFGLLQLLRAEREAIAQLRAWAAERAARP